MISCSQCLLQEKKKTFQYDNEELHYNYTIFIEENPMDDVDERDGEEVPVDDGEKDTDQVSLI